MFRSLSYATLALAFACGAPETTAPPKPAEPFVPVLSLRPVAISLARGATQTFQAEINGPEGLDNARQPVKWEVLEAGGGVISAGGLYTAPAAAGVYHVKVTREDFPQVTATATITVK